MIMNYSLKSCPQVKIVVLTCEWWANGMKKKYIGVYNIIKKSAK